MHTLKQSQFSFERLDVWRVAMEALRAIKALEFKRFGDLKQQLDRAALSIVAISLKASAKTAPIKNASSVSLAAAHAKAQRWWKARTSSVSSTLMLA